MEISSSYILVFSIQGMLVSGLYLASVDYSDMIKNQKVSQLDFIRKS